MGYPEQKERCMYIKTGWYLIGLLSLTVCSVGRADTVPLTRVIVEAAILAT